MTTSWISNYKREKDTFIIHEWREGNHPGQTYNHHHYSHLIFTFLCLNGPNEICWGGFFYNQIPCLLPNTNLVSKSDNISEYNDIMMMMKPARPLKREQASASSTQRTWEVREKWWNLVVMKSNVPTTTQNRKERKENECYRKNKFDGLLNCNYAIKNI